MSNKILVTARTFGTANPGALKMLQDAGFSCTKVDADRSPEAFLEELQESVAIILGNNPLSGEAIRQGKNLKIIAKHGSGTGNIDLAMAKEMGIVVTNVPTVNTNTIADLTFAHIQAALSGIIRADGLARQGRHFYGRELYGKTLGFIGFGAVAQAVASRAAGFNLTTIFHDPFSEAGEHSLEDIVSQSDIISVHAPLTELTENMISEDVLLAMKKDAVLVNLGRSGVIDEHALFKVMKQGHLFAAALQAQTEEEGQTQLMELPNVAFAPPILNFATETISAVSQTCAINVLRKLSGQDPDFIVS